MKKIRLLALPLVLAFIAVLGLLSVAKASTGEGGGPQCEIQFSQSFNHVTYTATWSGGHPLGEYPFEFGDGSPADVLNYIEGTKVLPHDYAYQVDNVVSYTAEFTVTDGPAPALRHCAQEVVIDDRPVVPPPTQTQKIFLPLVSYQPAPPTASLTTEVGPTWNHVVAHIKWEGAYGYVTRLEWGDNSYTEQVTSQGDRYLDHDYAWPGGQFTIEFIVPGPGGTTVVTKTLHLQP